ncbi:MAG: MFS transporter [Burkholderiaceae bacterium]
MSEALTPRQRSRGLTALMSSTVVSLSGQFMVTPLLVFLLSERQVPVSIIGLFSAASWLGILCTTPWAAQIVARIGYRQALLLSLALPCLTLSGIALTHDILLWAVLNFIGGAAMSLRWIVGEACVAELAPPHRRGRIVGLYQTLLGASFVLAPALLAWMGPTHPLAPWTAVGALALGVVLTLFVPPLPVAADQSAHAGLGGLWMAARAMPAVVMAGMFGGFFEIGIASLLPAYGLAVGFAGAAALLVSASGLGSLLVMLPLGEATDRYSARTVMHVPLRGNHAAGRTGLSVGGELALACLAAGVPVGRCGRRAVHAGDDQPGPCASRPRADQCDLGAGVVLYAGRHERPGDQRLRDRAVAALRATGCVRACGRDWLVRHVAGSLARQGRRALTGVGHRAAGARHRRASP